MKIVIFNLGSRGDIQPYVALAAGLRQAGHAVTLVVPRPWTGFVEAHGVAAIPVEYNPAAVMQQPEVRAVMQRGNPIRQFQMMQAMMNTGNVEAMEVFWQAAQASDLVIQGGTGGGGVEAATQFKLPLVYAYVLPFPPTRAFPAFFLPPQAGLGGPLNRLTHVMAHGVLWRGLGGPLINKWRTTRLGLPAWRSYSEMSATANRLKTPWVFGYSPSVLPKPPDWEDVHHVTGYWFLNELPGWQPPAELARFLESGPPPVYVGYGSLGGDDPARLTRLVLRALELSGQRGVLLTGGGGLVQLETAAPIFYLDEAPHAWLFPRMAAIVHHGGAGTTGAGLRAGKAGIVTPFAGDQLAWAERVAQLGVGPRAAPVKRLTAEKLAEAIGIAVNDQAMRARAAALGEKIRAEDGLGNAVAIIERHAAEFGQH